MINIPKERIFCKEQPTAFVVASPLQLLCAIEAIHEFEVLNYKIIVVLIPHAPRNEQILSMVNCYNLPVETVYTTDISMDDLIHEKGYFADIKNVEKFSRIFIGDYYHYEQYRVAYKYANQGSLLIFCDDGNDSISYFKDSTLDPKPDRIDKLLVWKIFGRNNRERYRRQVCNFLQSKGIVNTNAFFTIFYNIENPKYLLYPNRFEYVSTLNSGRTNRCVVIVGAILNYIPQINHISEKRAELIFHVKLSEIKSKYPDIPIYYIPHGRDVSTEMPQMCSELGIEYFKIPESIEGYMLKSNLLPVAIYGEGSTALYNLKLLYPDAAVTSWFFLKKFDNPKYHIEKLVADCYRDNGIIIDNIPFKRGKLEVFKKRVLYNILGVFLIPFTLLKAFLRYFIDFIYVK